MAECATSNSMASSFLVLKGSAPLPWSRADALESLDRFWKDGKLFGLAHALYRK